MSGKAVSWADRDGLRAMADQQRQQQQQQQQQAPCAGGTRQVLLGWDRFRSRMLLGLVAATIIWAAVYFPLIIYT